MKASVTDNYFAINQHDFLVSIYREHLEEISFLYSQKLDLIHDPNLDWQDLDGLINLRIEAHISGLFLGNDRALSLCMDQAAGNDSGELYGAMRVFCRHHRQDMIQDSLEQLDVSDGEKVKAVSDALSAELPPPLHEPVLRPLFEKGPEFAQIAARVCACQRLDYENDVCRAIDAYSSIKPVALALLQALGRIRLSVSAVAGLISLLSHKDNDIVRTTIYTLVRTDEARQVKPVSLSSWPVTAIALSRGQDSFQEILTHPDPEKDKALALGILGDIRAVPELISRLSDPETAENAALGLFLITGADLWEDHFIPDDIDPANLFVDELEKYKRGELYAPGEEPGQTITRISQNKDAWQAWWDENQAMYSPDRRYRNGIPFSPESMIHTLRSGTSPDILRNLAYEELVIRYGIDAPFETDMTVKDQHGAISALEKQVFHVDPGQWHYKGDAV